MTFYFSCHFNLSCNDFLCLIDPVYFSGTGILPNSLLHLNRWGNHLHTFKLSTNSIEINLPEFTQHQSISTLQEALEVITGKTWIKNNI